MKTATRDTQHVTRPETTSRVCRPASAAPVLAGGVFSINFIRHEVIPPQVQRKLLTAGAGWLLLNVIVLTWLVVAMAGAVAQSQVLRLRVTKQMASAGTADRAAQEMSTLRQHALENTAKLQAVIAMEQQRFPVGEKLAGLTKTLPPRTWLTNLSGDRSGRTMTIQAAYLINPASPYDLPTKGWLAALKEDPSFGQGLTRLEMGQSSRKRVGEAELFLFDLEAAWQ
jgi:Tfp pilus assembly protein PilN